MGADRGQGKRQRLEARGDAGRATSREGLFRRDGTAENGRLCTTALWGSTVISCAAPNDTARFVGEAIGCTSFDDMDRGNLGWDAGSGAVEKDAASDETEVALERDSRLEDWGVGVA